MFVIRERLYAHPVLFPDSEILDSEDDGATLLRNLGLTTWRHIPAYLGFHEKPSFTSVEFSIENLPAIMNYYRRTVLNRKTLGWLRKKSRYFKGQCLNRVSLHRCTHLDVSYRTHAPSDTKQLSTPMTPRYAIQKLIFSVLLYTTFFLLLNLLATDFFFKF